MKNTKLSELLRSCGLSEKESEIYLSIMELGRATILEIAQHSKIKRSTVYEIVPDLEDKNVIKKTKQGKRLYWVAESPRMVLTLFREREERFREAMPELMAIYKAQEKRPKVFFYQGRDEIQRMYDDTLREGKPIYNYTSTINLYQYLDRDWVSGYIAKRVQLGIHAHILAVDSQVARDWRENAESELREIKLIPNKNYDFSADVQIYGHKVIICTYRHGEGLFGLLIEDENIAKMQKMTFDLMWGAIQ
ncbi:MAG: helix-turn-helix domain-containing protein [bacterium]